MFCHLLSFIFPSAPLSIFHLCVVFWFIFSNTSSSYRFFFFRRSFLFPFSLFVTGDLVKIVKLYAFGFSEYYQQKSQKIHFRWIWLANGLSEGWAKGWTRVGWWEGWLGSGLGEEEGVARNQAVASLILPSSVVTTSTLHQLRNPHCNLHESLKLPC